MSTAHRVGLVGWSKGPAQDGLAAAGVQTETIVVTMHFVEASRARGDFDQRFAIHMQENALARDDDGSPLLVLTGVALAGGTRAAEGEIIGAVRDPFFLEPREQFGRKLAGLLASDRKQGESKTSADSCDLNFYRHRAFIRSSG